MKLLIRNHKPRTKDTTISIMVLMSKYSKYLKQIHLDSFKNIGMNLFLRINTEKNDWILELNTEPDGNKLEKILEIKNVEEYNA